jgi:phosphatidylinositol-3-phosphatase
VKRRIAAAAAAIALLAIGAPAAATAAPAPASAGTVSEGVPQLGHVFVIIGENTSLNQVTAKNMSYLVQTFKPKAAWLTGYRATGHFSTGNYVAMTSGQFTHCEQEDDPPSDCHQGVENIFHQLDAAGVPWQEWNESMPSPCYLTNAGDSTTFNSYRVKHNPAVYYDNVEGAGGVWSASTPSTECLHDVIATGGTGPNDTSALNDALASGDVGRLTYIIPNQCEDGHDNCKTTGGSRWLQFDRFLRREVPKITASPAFGRNGLVIVVFDEADASTLVHDGGPVVWAAMGRLVQPGLYGGAFNHYSFLRTLEDGFRLDGYAGNAATAAPIDMIWK